MSIEHLERQLAELVHNYTDDDRPQLDQVLAELREVRHGSSHDATRLP